MWQHGPGRTQTFSFPKHHGLRGDCIQSLHSWAGGNPQKPPNSQFTPKALKHQDVPIARRREQWGEEALLTPGRTGRGMLYPALT